MKNIKVMLSVLFCSTLLLAITANSAEVAKPNSGQPVVEQSISHPDSRENH